MQLRLLLAALLLIAASMVHAETWDIYDPAEAYTPPTTSGTTYYVKTNGSDAADGLSVANAWQTLAKAFYRYTNRGAGGNGVRILVLGGTYYEKVAFPNSWTYGTSESTRTILAAYDNTEVILDSSITNKFGAWTLYSGSIYKSTSTGISGTNAVRAVVINNNFKTYRSAASLATVDVEGEWFYDTSDNTIYVWTPAAVGDPTGDDVVILQDAGDSASGYGISIESGGTAPNYVTISHITQRGSNAHGVQTASGRTNLKIEKSKFLFNSKGAINLAGQVNAVVSKNYIYGNVMRNWPRGMWNAICANLNAGGWPSAVGGSGNDNALITGNVIRDNGGEGTLAYNSAYGDTWEYNILVDNWSVGIYLDRHPGSIVRNNLIYSTGEKATEQRTGCSAGLDTGRLIRYQWSDGIVFANESVTANKVQDFQIYNNIIVNMIRGVAEYADYDTSVNDAVISNNTIVVANVDPYTSDLYNSVQRPSGILLRNQADGSPGNDNSIVKNNIVIALADNTLLQDYLSSGESDVGVTFDNNIYYHAGTHPTPFKYKGTEYNWANYRTQSSQDASSLNQTPGLAGASWAYPLVAIPDPFTGQSILLETGIVIGNFIPSVGAVAIDNGADLSAFYTTDFDNDTRTTFDIGAYEYGGADATPSTFSFTDVTGAALSTLTTTSPCVTVAGIDAGQTPAISISGTGCQYNVDGGAYTANAGTVGLDNVVCMQGTSSASYSTVLPSCTLTIGGVTDSGAPWTVTTGPGSAGVIGRGVTLGPGYSVR